MSFSTKFPSFLILLFVFHALFFTAIVVNAQNSGGGDVVPLSTQLWCVAKNNAEDAALQAALSWACGAGGADCRPIQQGGPCYDPTDILKMASYVFNDYFLKNGMTDESCSFDNNAAVTSLNPSYGNCKFPSSSGGASNATFSGSTSVGMGTESADYNGCYKKTQLWLWPLVGIHLVFLMSRTVLVSQ